MKIHSLIPVLAAVLLILILAGCAASVEEAMEAPAAQEPAMATSVETLVSEVEKEVELPVVEEPAVEEPAAEKPIEGETSSPQPTATPGTLPTPSAAAPTALPSAEAPLPTAMVEPRMVEV